MLARTQRYLVTLGEGAALIVLILVAAYVSMGRILVANIDSFHADIERALADALNVDVRLAEIHGSWVYLDPVVSIGGLVVGNGSAPAIDLGKVHVRVDTVASLRERGFVLREIEVHGLRIALRQDDKGGWFVEGLPRSGKAFNPDPIFDSLNYVQSIMLTSVDVRINGRRQQFRLTNQENESFQLLADGGVKHFVVPLVFEHGDERSAFELAGQYSGDPREPAELKANLYLKLPAFDMTDLLPEQTEGVRVAGMSLEGEFWMDWYGGRFDFYATPQLTEVALEHEGERVVVARNVTADVVAWGPSLNNIQAHFSNASGEFGSSKWQVGSASGALREADGRREAAFSLPALDVAGTVKTFVKFASALGLVDVEGSADLEEINPRGELSDLLLLVDLDEFDRSRLTANLKGVRIDKWKGAPGFSTLDGFVSAGPKSGYLDVHNEAFTMDFELFPAEWKLDSAHGRVNYLYLPGQIQLDSDRIALAGGALAASGRLHLNLPLDDDDMNRTWGLEIGIEQADLADAYRYLPSTMAPEVIAWLNRSVLGGESKEAGLLFHGTLGKEAPRISKVYDLYFKVAEAGLDYAPDWPPVEDLAATIYIGNWGVFSEDASGRVFESRIDHGVVSLPIHFGEQADSVLINAQVSGPLSDGIRVLNETPVSTFTNKLAEGWIGSGQMLGVLDLNIPIGPRKDEGVGVDVTVMLADNNIFMTEYDLDVSDIKGSVRYETDAGLSAKSIAATIFNYPVKGKIATVAGEGGGVVEVNFDGHADVADLYAWSGQSLLTRTDGSADYNAVLHVPYGSRSNELTYIEAISDLSGVAINLPLPMKKAAGDMTHLVYRQSFLKPGNRIDIELGDATRASFKTTDGFINGGRLHFGTSPMGAVAYNDIKVSGDLDFVEYDEWMDVTRFLDQKTEVSLTSEFANALEAIDVHVGLMRAFDIELDDVATYITRSSGAWNIKLTNEIVSGLIKVSDADDQPLNIGLGYLRFEESTDDGDKDAAEAPDPFGNMNPADLVAADVKIEKLSIGDEDYGTWSFRLRPDATGAVFENLVVEVKGLSIGEDARVFWTRDGGMHSSRFEGGVKVPDLAIAFKQWGFAPSIEGKDFSLDAAVSWPGSPAVVDIDTMTGLVNLRQGQGRFVQAESATGALRLLGMFDFASLARRLRFDFSDVVNKGFTFTDVEGAARLDKGIVSVVEPIVIVGAGSTFKVGGSVDLNTNTLDNDMIVTLPVSRNLPWYAAYSAIATGPLAGAGVWIAQKVFENQINAMSSAKYKISGTIDKPDIEFVSIFTDSVRETPAEKKPGTTGE